MYNYQVFKAGALVLRTAEAELPPSAFAWLATSYRQLGVNILYDPYGSPIVRRYEKVK
jgi:hypothetical protein